MYKIYGGEVSDWMIKIYLCRGSGIPGDLRDLILLDSVISSSEDTWLCFGRDGFGFWECNKPFLR